MAVIETIYDLHNHADKKGFSRVHIMSIKPIFLKLSEGIESVVMDLKGISHASDCILG
jgi:hypothetical protein